MRELLPALVFVAVIGFGSPAWAGDPTVSCGCSQGGFHGPGHYEFALDSAGYPVWEFFVGTNDIDPANYTNVLIPPGWNFAIESWGFSQSYGSFTYHAYMPGTPSFGLTAGSAHWWTDDPACQIQSFTFGFDHPWVSQDVGWGLIVRWGGSPPDLWFAESWEEPVGRGAGPLHGPGHAAEACSGPEGCDAEDYCYLAQCLSELGVCLPRPEACTERYDPVCGCNAVTYGNACLAAMDGMNVAYDAACLTGDLDLDCDVDLEDLSRLLANYGTTGGATYADGDLDGDRDVDLADLAALLANYGQTCP